MAEVIPNVDREERPWLYPDVVRDSQIGWSRPGGAAGTRDRTWRSRGGSPTWLRWVLFLMVTLAALVLSFTMGLRPSLAATCTTTTPTPDPAITPAPTPTPTVSCVPDATSVVLDSDTSDVLRYGMGLLVLFTSAAVVTGWARRG